MGRRDLIVHLSCSLSTLASSSPFSELLTLCATSESLRGTRSVHASVVKGPFSAEVFILNRLISVYGKCGRLEDARKVFDRMGLRNTYSWNNIISLYLKRGFVDEGVRLFQLMPDPDRCSWNVMIAGLVQENLCEEAMDYFVSMHRENCVLDEYSFGSAINACAKIRDWRWGTQIHGLAVKYRCSTDVCLGSALIDMYSKCGEVHCCQMAFDEMEKRNLVSWNSLISCYEQNGPVDEALEIFVRMMSNGFRPDEVTLASVVSACSSLAAVRQGCEIHAYVLKHHQFRDDLIICNALVDMYSKCGWINDAWKVFQKMPTRSLVSETSMVSGYVRQSVDTARTVFSKMKETNIVSWNALIAGYTQAGENEEAVSLFNSLKRQCVFPTHYTFGNILNACANLADLELGRQVHCHVLKHGFWFHSGGDSDVFVANSMIDMYMKCGSVADGDLVFEKMLVKTCVSWNAMVVGYAQNGYGEKALKFFNKMVDSGQKPDHITMVGVLCACIHSGLVDLGRKYFNSMEHQYGLIPQKDHYTCMVDLLGRAGFVEEAQILINKMPMEPDAIVWGSLLAACRVHRCMALGRYAASKVLELDTTNSGPYVALSNMYAEIGQWRDVFGIRKVMRHRGIVKQPGCSWIKLNGAIHVFMVKDKKQEYHLDLAILLETLEKQMNRDPYVKHVEDINNTNDEY